MLTLPNWINVSLFRTEYEFPLSKHIQTDRQEICKIRLKIKIYDDGCSFLPIV